MIRQIEISRLISHMTPRSRAVLPFFSLWLLAMMALPISLWVWGDIMFAPMTTLAALFQGLLVFVIVSQSLGTYAALRMLVLVAIVTWTAEFIGSHTGFPFGVYHYTELLQPQIGGVPALIPLAWFMMLPPSWTIAQMITGRLPQRWRRMAFIAVSAAALTAWDLFLDPQMVTRGFWVWEYPYGYFGIPWSNYAGWLLTSAIATWIACPTRLEKNNWLMTIYGTVWFLQSVGQAIFWSQPGPAFFGSIAMGGLFIAAYWQDRQDTA